MKLSKDTQEFIARLLVKELEAEFIQDNDNPLEVEYVVDLIKASKEYGNKLGFPFNIIIDEAIENIMKG